jgi:hypothetical protein
MSDRVAAAEATASSSGMSRPPEKHGKAECGGLPRWNQRTGTPRMAADVNDARKNGSLEAAELSGFDDRRSWDSARDAPRMSLTRVFLT